MNINFKKENKGTKGALEFGWIFAVIVGGIILFFAFYFVGTQLMGSQEFKQTQSTQAVDVLFTPFSYSGSIAEMTASTIKLDEESKLTFECQKADDYGPLGYNEVTTSKIYKGEIVEGISRKAYDKYIFGKEIEGKTFMVMSKPFELPWRISDLIYIFPYNNKYCFFNSPQRVRTELERIENFSSQKHFFFNDNEQEGCINVCFSSYTGTVCDIIVNKLDADYSYGYVINQGETRYYYKDALMYGAIFSDKGIYDCNLQRLMARGIIQAQIFAKKADSLKQKQCISQFSLPALKSEFEKLKSSATNEQIKINLGTLKTQSNLLNEQNERADCPLY